MRIALRRATFLMAAWLLGTVALEPPADAATARAFGAWDYALQSSEDGPPSRAMARILGEEGTALWISCTRIAQEDDEHPAIAVAATVTQKAYLGPSGATGRSTVYWLDDRPPELSYWVYRDRYGQLREKESVESFVASLTTAEKLIIELTDYRLETRNVRFSLKPSETQAIVERFSKDCQVIAGAKS